MAAKPEGMGGKRGAPQSDREESREEDREEALIR